MRNWMIICAVMALGACASTKPKSIDVRPVELTEEAVFNAESAHGNARALQAAGNDLESYKAYSVLIMRAPETYESFADVYLEYGDVALGIGGVKYYAEARAAYALAAEFGATTDEQQGALLAGQTLLRIADDSAVDPEGDLRLALTMAKNDVRLWNALGRIYDENDDFLAAQDCYLSALEAAQSQGRYQASAINNLGVSFLRQGRTKQARAKFVQAHELEPDNEVYDNNRLLASIVLDNGRDSLGDISDNRAALIYNRAGEIFEKNGKINAAIGLYQKAIDLSPTYHKTAEISLARLSAAP